MQSKRRLAKLESLISQNKDADSERLQALVFIAQSLGEDVYDYFFDMHHLIVFSQTLESDIEKLSMQDFSIKSEKSELSDLVTHVVATAPTIQIQAAAAFLYFEQKGYSADEIEKSMNAEESVMAGAKRIIASLKKAEKKELAASGARF